MFKSIDLSFMRRRLTPAFATLLCYLLAQSESFAQKRPLLTPGKSGFAFVQERETEYGVIQKLMLARMTNIFPKQRAEIVRQLGDENIDLPFSFQFIELSASPENDILLVYSWQSNGGGWEYPSLDHLEFTDLRIEFFDMRTGDRKGSFNEHIFSGHNRTVVVSDLFEAWRASILDSFTPEEVSIIDEGLDYELEVEGAIEGDPYWQWNEDGTITVYYDLGVFGVGWDSFPEFLGVEDFGVTYDVSGSRIQGIGFDEPRVAASFPQVYKLEPVNGPSSRMTILGREILFPATFPLLRTKHKYNRKYLVPKEGIITEGNIPQRFKKGRIRYRSFPGY